MVDEGPAGVTSDGISGIACAGISWVPGPNRVVVIGADGGIFLRAGAVGIEMARTRQSSEAAEKSPPVDYFGFPLATHPPSRLFGTERLLLIAYGQSNSQGQAATPVISTEPRQDALMFTGGVRPHDALADTAVDEEIDESLLTQLVPLAETVSPDGTKGETQLTGCIEMITHLLATEDGIDFGSSGQSFIGCAPGYGSRAVRELAAGTAPFSRLTACIHAARELSAAAGQSFSIAGIAWTQGEKDYQLRTDPVDYRIRLQRLRMDAELYARHTTGVDAPLPMFVIQTATHQKFGHATPGIALAQLELHADPNFCFVAPSHFFPYARDDVHFTNVGMKWSGAYWGLALKRWLLDGQKQRPLLPLSAQPFGPVLVITFDVQPGRHLVLDRDSVPDPGNAGFALVTPAGEVLEQAKAPMLIGRDKVKLHAAAPIPPGTCVRYGWIGNGRCGGGNLRDNAGDRVLLPSLGLPLHTWAPIFEYVVA